MNDKLMFNFHKVWWQHRFSWHTSLSSCTSSKV